MNRRCLGVRAWTWAVGAGALIALSTFIIATGAMSDLCGNACAAQGTPWYAEAQPPAASSTMTAQPGAEKEKAENPAFYAKLLSKAFHNAADKVLPSVVAITNTPKIVERPKEREQKPSPNDDLDEIPFGFRGTPFGDLFRNNPEFRWFFKDMPSVPGMPRMPRGRAASVGSGVIVDPSGVILTNNHVVAGGGKIMVRLQDGREFKAVDIKTDPKTDLAVLRIEGAGKLPAVRLGNSDKVEVGDWVLALGQPFGLQGTVTAGIVSAKGRGIGITDSEDFLQTDAAINPGNSGGPLVNLDGEVVGINTAISSNNGGYQGVGFAIPINLAKWVGGQLVTTGKVRRAYLGVVIQPVTQSLAEQFKVKVREGVLVTEVRPDTPAAKAGLKAGDIIVEFAGKPVSNPRELQNLVETAQPGGTQSLLIVRDGKRTTLQVNCAEMPADFGIARAGVEGPNNAETSRFEELGIQVEDLTPAIAEQLGIKVKHGVVITEVRPGSPANQAGLTTGMVITEANRQPVKTVADFRKALGDKPLKKGILLLVRSAAGSRFMVIRVESE